MDAPLSLVQFDDPNTALGLAVRLLAVVPPFDAFPAGASIGGLIWLIDRKCYGFARRGECAVGFVGWGLASFQVAEGWAFGGRHPRAEELGEGPCVLVFGMRATSPEITRFIWARLRDDLFREKNFLYYIRDQRRPDGTRIVRGVRLRRPATRRQPGCEDRAAGQ
jgi:hypothetical protein